MANTINDLYLKYVNKVGSTLERDRYFQYLFEMVQNGEHTLHQTNQVLHKVVDERWLTTIEESLDAINNIIDKPRRFVTTKEEVVPVALAKKITADSVRHLSMNTQFIASDEDGDIQPTRVLNVSTEESYDLYENRFIYHLIQRLVTFIDKRTDVIFWSTGDEKRDKLSMVSKVDDAYEEIEYKIEMTVKNRQSFAENDSDNMQVFMRIDRVRRLVMALRNSAFCSLMAGCSKVHSPIQRTNLMMKDPNYRTCYKLWHFLESYDEVGYTIEEQNSALEFDEEYMFQMYTSLITNYTLFKSIMESDSRNLDEAVLAKKRKVTKPKFIKKVVEEIVDDYDLPDVEVRKVIIEEVTERELQLEKELEEETSRRKEAEEAREEAEIQTQQMMWQMRAEQQAQAEEMGRIQEELEKEAADAKNEYAKLKETSESELTKAREESVKALEEEKEKARQELEEERERARRELEEEKERARQELEEERERARRELEEEKERARRELEEEKERSSRELIRVKEEADSAIEKEKEECRQALYEEREAARLAIQQAEADAAERKTSRSLQHVTEHLSRRNKASGRGRKNSRQR